METSDQTIRQFFFHVPTLGRMDPAEDIIQS